MWYNDQHHLEPLKVSIHYPTYYITTKLINKDSILIRAHNVWMTHNATIENSTCNGWQVIGSASIFLITKTIELRQWQRDRIKTNNVIPFKIQFYHLFDKLESFKRTNKKVFSYLTQPQGICPHPAPVPCDPEQRKWQIHPKNWFHCSASRGRKSP